MAEQRSSSGNFNNRWKFNGKELDEETGLYYYGARFYNPSTSIWLSVDPLVEQTMDAYGFCYQNPIKYVDPNGKEPTPFEAALIAAHVYGDSKFGLVGGWQESWVFHHNVHNNDVGLKAAMYERIKEDGTMEYTFAFAGTEDLKLDGLEDLLQIIGQSKQYDQVAKMMSQLNKEMSENELTFVGHSLGGGLATLAALMTVRTAVTFNPARLSRISFKKYKRLMKGETIINNFIHESDPLDKVQQSKVGKSTLIFNGNDHKVNGGLLSNIFTGHLMGTMINRMFQNGQATQHRGKRDDEEVEVSRSPRYF